jgi:hypothetical protein
MHKCVRCRTPWKADGSSTGWASRILRRRTPIYTDDVDDLACYSGIDSTKLDDNLSDESTGELGAMPSAGAAPPRSCMPLHGPALAGLSAVPSVATYSARHTHTHTSAPLPVPADHAWDGSMGSDIMDSSSTAPGPNLRHLHLILEFCDRGTLHHAIARGTFHAEGRPINVSASAPAAPAQPHRATGGVLRRGCLKQPTRHACRSSLPHGMPPSAPASVSLLPSSRYVQHLLLPTALEIAQGLSYLHGNSCRLVHCDLSCSNVLLTSCGDASRGFRALLSDFGEAHRALHKPSAPRGRGLKPAVPQPTALLCAASRAWHAGPCCTRLA